MSGEVWRIIPSAPAYEASSAGRIRNATTRLVRKTRVKDTGYEDVSIYVDGRLVKRLVHRLVCEAFHGTPPSVLHQSAHQNGDNSDNRQENLRWASIKENHNDKRKHGTLLFGSRNPQSKLTQTQVDQIRDRKRAGESPYRIAKDLGIHFSTAYRIANGRAWTHSQ